MRPRFCALFCCTSLCAAFGNRIVVLVLLATCGALPVTAWAQPGPSVLDDPAVRQVAKEGLDLLYNMQFDEAASRFDEISRKADDHPIGPFLEALTLWWEVLMDLSDTQHDEAFYAAMAEVIDRCDARLAVSAEDFDAKFFKGMALGFRGRLRSNRRDWIRAAADGKRAMDYVLAVARADTTSHDFVLGPGLYNYYAAIIPARFPFVRAITTFLPKGNRELGLAQIGRTATHGYFMQTEAIYFLLQIYYLYEADYRASVEHVSMLRARHPGNSFFHTLEGRIYARWGSWSRSDTIFASVLDHYRRGTRGYTAPAAEQALYYLARGRMTKQDYETAVSYLLSLDALSARLDQHTYFKVMGRLQQGMAYDALGRRTRAVERYEQVLAMKEWGNSHARAQRYLERPFGSKQ